MLEQAAGGWRLTTRAEHDSVLKKYFAKKGENRLSLAALETLAIVAYRQPITAPEVSDIRGVNSTSAIRTLLERRMIRVGGRKNVVGSPFLYRTTKDFLVHFGLNDIRDLPRLEEFGDLIGESIADELVAAINAAPEPSTEGIIEESSSESLGSSEFLGVDNENAATPDERSDPEDAATYDERSDAENAEEPQPPEEPRGTEEPRNSDDGTTFEEQPSAAADETQLESSRRETNEE
jgi:segregation and condensation protein B